MREREQVKASFYRKANVFSYTRVKLLFAPSIARAGLTFIKQKDFNIAGVRLCLDYK